MKIIFYLLFILQALGGLKCTNGKREGTDDFGV
jgi:hypothetical protein